MSEGNTTVRTMKAEHSDIFLVHIETWGPSVANKL
jgi:hypothetical protein